MKKVFADRPCRTGRRWAAAVGIACGVALMVKFFGYFIVSNLVFRFVARPEAETVVFSGSSADGMILDGHGGWFNEGKLTDLMIMSERKGDKWDRPADIIIRNMQLRGSIRIMGLGPNGEGRHVRESSYFRDHTERAQSVAPTRVLISNVTFHAVKRIPLYLAPGVTYITVENCEFIGWSKLAVYLDAESGHNMIRNNRFAVYTGREVVAVDGSANNCIESNRFDRMTLGGIYLYRNCGEGGTVRHQTPHGNIIRGNRFCTTWLEWGSWGVWLGSRNGAYRSYSELDAGYDFGSSVDNRDFADGNVLQGNTFTPYSFFDVCDRGKDNSIFP